MQVPEAGCSDSYESALGKGIPMQIYLLIFTGWANRILLWRNSKKESQGNK